MFTLKSFINLIPSAFGPMVNTAFGAWRYKKWWVPVPLQIVLLLSKLHSPFGFPQFSSHVAFYAVQTFLSMQLNQHVLDLLKKQLLYQVSIWLTWTRFWTLTSSTLSSFSQDFRWFTRNFTMRSLHDELKICAMYVLIESTVVDSCFLLYTGPGSAQR